MSDMFPSVVRLSIHLPGEEVVIFDDKADHAIAGAQHETTLTQFFHYTARQTGLIGGPPSCPRPH